MKLILGLTGLDCSGKTLIAEYLVSQKKFLHISISGIIREEAKRRGLTPSREVLINVGNDLREKEGKDVLIKRACEKIENERSNRIVVESIRNPGEVETLRRMEGFYLIGVVASPKVRFTRMEKRGKLGDPIIWKKFCELEARHEGKGEKETGQQMKAVLAMTDFRVLNNGPKENTFKLIDSIFKRFDH